ncbi:hypothetical protein BH10BAC3_BH10BAC3_43040 [soil metagenome]
MPIRMVDDPQDQNEFNENSGGGGRGGSPGGGGGGLLGLLPLLFGLLRTKFGIVILLIAAGAYFFLGRGGGTSQNASAFSLGGDLDPREFAKAKVYEGLEDDNAKNPLPEYISLAKFAPERQNQGHQGSCVAWSSAYGAHTILEAASRGTNPNQTAFSPSYVYNQIGLDGCQGSYIIRAMELLQKKGGVPYNSFPYTDQDCSNTPSTSLDAMAAQNRIHGFNRLTTTEDPEGISVRAIKEHLAKDAPVVIGMMVGGSFMEGMMGQKLWQPSQGDYSQQGFGGHALCVIGYDDRLSGGSFQIMNSWGPEWGENGIGWVRYADFKEFVREAYGLDPLPKQGEALNKPFDCEIGLMQVDEKAKPTTYIPLKAGGGNVFTSSTLPIGVKFKVEVKNSTECYVYVFGRETDGSSYTLFPYPSKNDPAKTAYSAYCGITGYRLFPKGKSMQADSIGTKDYIAVVVSKEDLNWVQLNEDISKNRTSYPAALVTALSGMGSGKISVSSTGSGNLHFTAPAAEKGVAYAVVEINKQ